MKNILYLSTIALLAVSAVSCTDNKRAKNYNEKTLVDDKAIAFVKESLEAGMTEIKAATVAQSKSKNPRVINFAKMMIADHNAMGIELKKLADEKYINRKAANDTLRVENQEMIDKLKPLTGLSFDKAYMQMMVADHAKVIDLFRSATRNRTNAIDNIAEKSLPKLIMHLDSAKAINASLK